MIPDGGIPTPAMCPPNPQGTRCAAGQLLCFQNAGGGAPAICLCAQGAWNCRNPPGGVRDAGAPGDGPAVAACPADARNGRSCPMVGATCAAISDGGFFGCICAPGDAGVQWRCNR
jgi:hypothetical protein